MSASLIVEGGLAEELPIDPFGSMPNWASRFAGLGGPDASPNPGYVFRTVPIRPGLGSITFSIHFFRLAATHGTLRIDVHAVSAFPGAEPSPLDAISVPLADLVDEGGVLEVRVMCRRNTLYELAADIVGESDANCDSISITADRRVLPGEASRGWVRQVDLAPRSANQNVESFIRSWMTRLDAPSLEVPTSQGWTPAQARSPYFRELARELRREDAPAEETWGEVFILRSLEAFSASPKHSSGVGFIAEPCALTSVLAARETKVLLVEHGDDGERHDPGLALESHFMPEICDEERFFQYAFLTAGNWLHISPALTNRFDFLWSLNANRTLDNGQFLHFVLSTIDCLQPGGMAVHVFDFADARDTDLPAHAIVREQLERLVAHALSHLNEVALLRLRRGKHQTAEVRPFALIVRRGRPN